MLEAVAAIAGRRDPLATSLYKFQKAASRNLCYGTIAKLERECLEGNVYTEPHSGKTKESGEPWESSAMLGNQGLNCNSNTCNVKSHRRYYGW